MSGPTPIGYAPNPFDPAATLTAVYKTIDEAKAAIPDGHTHALLFNADYKDADGPSGQISYVQAAPDDWDVIGSIGYDKPHGVSAGVIVAKSW